MIVLASAHLHVLAELPSVSAGHTRAVLVPTAANGLDESEEPWHPSA